MNGYISHLSRKDDDEERPEVVTLKYNVSCLGSGSAICFRREDLLKISDVLSRNSPVEAIGAYRDTRDALIRTSKVRSATINCNIIHVGQIDTTGIREAHFDEWRNSKSRERLLRLRGYFSSFRLCSFPRRACSEGQSSVVRLRPRFLTMWPCGRLAVIIVNEEKEI
ncbi:hypothetical protein PUN28_014407 [Cardiocondyla obscurior]|uniref:Uncharacterized protein n=1 Tax=Cardiocondyla obscurior TaxID=286306 RepID=A0AAW2F194_9HYME